MRSQPASYHGYRFPPDIISHAVWLYHRAPQQAVGKMTEGPSKSASRRSGAGFKPPQAAVMKSGGRERWGHVEHDSAGVDQKDERKCTTGASS